MHQNFTKNAPYTVMAEDHWDYYKDPRIVYQLFEGDNYWEAVAFAMDYYDNCDKQDLEWPYVTALRIHPNPVGISFKYQEYIDFRLKLINNNIMIDSLKKELENNPISLFRQEMLSLNSMVRKALQLALKYHAGVKRKADGLPYIIHILNVSALIFDEGDVDIDILAASICHDLLEDTACSEEEIVDNCNAEVLRIVKAVSVDPELDKSGDWEKKKLDYIQSVENGGKKAMIVCLCDKVSNLKSLFTQHAKEGASIWEKFNRGKETKLWFEKKVLEMFKRNNLEHSLMKVYEDMLGDYENLV